MKIVGDVLAAMDRGHAVTVVVLNMSSAFDDVCHQPLIDRLQGDFGVTGTCLQWITSYTFLNVHLQYASTAQHPSLSVPTTVFHRVRTGARAVHHILFGVGR